MECASGKVSAGGCWPAAASLTLDLLASLPLQINTLFPSPKTEEGIKGGVVLLRMRPPAAGASSTPLQLSVTYTDRGGKQFRCGSRGGAGAMLRKLVSLQQPRGTHPVSVHFVSNDAPHCPLAAAAPNAPWECPLSSPAAQQLALPPATISRLECRRL